MRGAGATALTAVLLLWLGACAPAADPAPAASGPTPTPSAPVASTGCPLPAPALPRLAGPDRYATAVAASSTLWDTASEALVVSGADFPDALAAGALAGARDAPLLLTPPDRFPDVVARELERLEASRVTVVGGPAAVSDRVVRAIRATASAPTVERVAGPDRFATAAAVAQLVGLGPDRTVTVVSGRSAPDAVSAGAWGARSPRTPTLLSGPSGLPTATREALEDLEAGAATVVGGPEAVPESVVEELRATGLRVQRVSGPDRYATAVAAVVAVESSVGPAAGVVAATGRDFPDALAAVAVAARLGAVPLLVDPADLIDTPAVGELLAERGAAWGCSAVVGGPLALGPRVAEQVAASTGAPPPDGDPTLLAAGDIASCGLSADSATAALLDGLPGTVLTLGDNAYERGTAAQFRDCYAPTWGRHRVRTRAAAGNHDYGTAGAEPYYAWFGARAGAAGQGWYAFDLGPAWRVLVLNSNCAAVGGCTAGSAQERWLRDQLATVGSRHVLAAWHHPLVSSGAHGDDARTQDLFATLVEAGADLVLTGHDHDYERFEPLGADGRPDPNGTVEFVVGTGGASLRSFGDIRPGSARRVAAHGVLVLTLQPTGYAWRFVDTAGAVRDDGARTLAPGG